MTTRIVIVFLSFMVFACQPKEEANQKPFYDLAGLVKSEVEYLQSTATKVTKEVMINGKKEEINPETVDWTKELAFFTEADINKAAYLNSYHKEELPSSEIYTLKADESEPVKSLTIVFDTTGKVSNVKAILTSENYLYNSERTIEMKLANEHLTDYHISGWQRLFIGTEKTFDIKGTVN